MKLNNILSEDSQHDWYRCDMLLTWTKQRKDKNYYMYLYLGQHIFSLIEYYKARVSRTLFIYKNVIYFCINF